MKLQSVVVAASIALGSLSIFSAEAYAGYNCRKTYSGGEVCSGTKNGQSYYSNQRKTYSGGYTRSGSDGYENCRRTYSGGKTCS
tara:strand:+ start:265 stop:516 length:252 start_codon:yes stop_codon:yes gene_type:complete